MSSNLGSKFISTDFKKQLSNCGDLIFSTRIIRIILYIYNVYYINKKHTIAFSRLAKDADITISHAIKLGRALEADGIVQRVNIDQRSYYLDLTPKGVKIAEAINIIHSEIINLRWKIN